MLTSRWSRLLALVLGAVLVVSSIGCNSGRKNGKAGPGCSPTGG